MGGTMLYEEVTVTEAPKNTDARHAHITGCINIDITVTDVNGPFLADTKLAHSFKDRIRSRFLADILTLTNCHLNCFGEEMAGKFLSSSIELITDNSQFLATALQFGKNLGNTTIWLCGIKAMLKVMLAEGGVSLAKLRIIQSIGNGTLHKLLYSITYKPPHIIDRVLRHSSPAQGIIGTCCQIIECIKQSTIQIKNKVIHYNLISYIEFFQSSFFSNSSLFRKLRVIIVFILLLNWSAESKSSMVGFIRNFH